MDLYYQHCCFGNWFLTYRFRFDTAPSSGVLLSEGDLDLLGPGDGDAEAVADLDIVVVYECMQPAPKSPDKK